MRKRTNPTSESAEAAAESVGRDKDKNNNPDVFSKWSFLAGRASLEAEIKELVEALGFYADRSNWERVEGHTKWASNLNTQDCALLNCGGGRARLALARWEGKR